MARTPMVTRTIMTTKATVLCMDLSAVAPIEKVLTLPRTYKDEKALMKAVEKAITDENIKPVKIKSTDTIETLYGMSEQDFINSAVILDNETRKPIATDEEADNE